MSNILKKLKDSFYSQLDEIFIMYEYIEDENSDIDNTLEYLRSMSPWYEIYQLNPCKDFYDHLIEYSVVRECNNHLIIVKQRLEMALEDSDGDIPMEYNFIHFNLI